MKIVSGLPSSVMIPLQINSTRSEISRAKPISCVTTSVVIPESVTVIGDGAFSGCESLTYIAIPSGIEQLTGRVFGGCTALTNVTMAKKTKYSKTVFEDCPNLKDIVRV